MQILDISHFRVAFRSGVSLRRRISFLMELILDLGLGQGLDLGLGTISYSNIFNCLRHITNVGLR